MVSEGSWGLLGPGLWCCWVRTMLLHRRPRSQSAQECGRGSSGNNVQRSNATLGPTRLSLLLLSSRRKQENSWAGAQKTGSFFFCGGGRHTVSMTLLQSWWLAPPLDINKKFEASVRENQNNVVLPSGGANINCTAEATTLPVCAGHKCHLQLRSHRI